MLKSNQTKKKVFAALLLGFALVHSPLSHASCEAQLARVGLKTRSAQSYDVFTDSAIALEKAFFAEIKTSCPVNLVVFAADQSSEMRGTTKQKLNFNYYAPGAQTHQNKLIFPAVSKDSALSFLVRFPSRQYSGAGHINKEMVAQLWDSQTQALLAEKKFSLDVDIKASSAVFFSGVKNRSLEVSLGEIYTNKRITWLPQLRVISTAPYDVTFKSDNAGKLVHTHDPSMKIDYEMTAGKEVLSLAKGEHQLFSADMTPFSGHAIPLSMKIGKVEGKAAGDYQDRLRISVRPRLVL